VHTNLIVSWLKLLCIVILAQSVKVFMRISHLNFFEWTECELFSQNLKLWDYNVPFLVSQTSWLILADQSSLRRLLSVEHELWGFKSYLYCLVSCYTRDFDKSCSLNEMRFRNSWTSHCVILYYCLWNGILSKPSGVGNKNPTFPSGCGISKVCITLLDSRKW